MNIKFASAVLSSQKNVKLALSAMMVAGAVLASGAASATVIDLGVLPVAPSLPKLFTEHHDFGAFEDTVKFSISSGALKSSLNNLKLSFTNPDLTVYDIASLSYTLFNQATNAQIGSALTGGNATYSNVLTAGESYYFKVTGNATGVLGGLYGMTLLTAVPEPETYGMMLGGLALIGFMAARRQAKKAA